MSWINESHGSEGRGIGGSPGEGAAAIAVVALVAVVMILAGGWAAVPAGTRAAVATPVITLTASMIPTMTPTATATPTSTATPTTPPPAASIETPPPPAAFIETSPPAAASTEPPPPAAASTETPTATATSIESPTPTAAATATETPTPAMRSAAAATFTNPHGSYSVTTDACAACHRSHTGQNSHLLSSAAPQSTLCFSCHDGTGSNYDVASEYSDVSVPTPDPTTSSFYSHPATTASSHTSGQEDEFAGVLNRHAECGDCHNPHALDASLSTPTSSGWTASGALAEIPGVTGTTSLTWKTPITYEYELCFKCHSSYTTLLSYSKESYKKIDKAAEFDPANASYHPVEAGGKNTTAAMATSLAGGSLWQFTTSDTIRCTHCHGNYRLVGATPTPGTPGPADRLAPHTSAYRGLLIANYRSRVLKLDAEPYDANDFALCYLCHDENAFITTGSGATNFDKHRRHVYQLGGTGGPGDIDTPGAGGGKGLCSECHYRIHSTKLAPWSSNQNYERGVNFAPNVEGRGTPEPIWDGTNQSCTLTCHGKGHNNRGY